MLEKEEALRLAAWLKPIPWALFHGDGTTYYTGKMFHGWMGSQTFYTLAGHKISKYKSVGLSKAMSIVQYPPVGSPPSEPSSQPPMVSAVQVLWLAGERVRYFARGHPQLRPKEAALKWNGEHKTDSGWRGKQAWDLST